MTHTTSPGTHTTNFTAFNWISWKITSTSTKKKSGVGSSLSSVALLVVLTKMQKEQPHTQPTGKLPWLRTCTGTYVRTIIQPVVTACSAAHPGSVKHWLPFLCMASCVCVNVWMCVYMCVCVCVCVWEWWVCEWLRVCVHMSMTIDTYSYNIHTDNSIPLTSNGENSNSPISTVLLYTCCTPGPTSHLFKS